MEHEYANMRVYSYKQSRVLGIHGYGYNVTNIVKDKIKGIVSNNDIIMRISHFTLKLFRTFTPPDDCCEDLYFTVVLSQPLDQHSSSPCSGDSTNVHKRLGPQLNLKNSLRSFCSSLP